MGAAWERHAMCESALRIIGLSLPPDGRKPLRSLEIEAIFEGRHINLRTKTRAVGAFN